LYSIPVFGWGAWDVFEGYYDNVWYAVVGFASLWAIATMVFGWPSLYIPTLMLVPVM